MVQSALGFGGPRLPLEDRLLPLHPPEPLALDVELLLKTLRIAKGSAGSP